MFLTLLLSGFFTFVELNCENLFDYHHDDGKKDVEFLPESTRHWTKNRYWSKLNHIAQALLSCSEEGIPDMIALCEVENDTVMHDLTKRSLLRNAGYEYLMTSSPDERGIDVALLYSPFSFSPIRSYAIRVEPVKGMRATRDVLYVCGETVSGDTLHVFVVHQPSMFGGEKYTWPFRQVVADRVCHSVDSIYALNPHAQLLIAGDFNDEAHGRSLQAYAQHGLMNLTKDAHCEHGVAGTYWYQGEWACIDHVLGSPNVAQKVYGTKIHSPLFLLEEAPQYGGYRPRRTYHGMRYQAGYSDHLPLVVQFTF